MVLYRAMAADLNSRLAADLDGAFADFVRAHQDGVYATALGLTRRHHDAEEVAQETFVRAYRALQGWDTGRIRELRARPWLAAIALNQVRNRARTARRRPATSSLEVAPDPAAGPDPADVAERLGEAGVWAQRLAALPAAQADAVVLRHVWGLPYAELADALDVPPGTAKARVHRGLAALREMVEAEPTREVS